MKRKGFSIAAAALFALLLASTGFAQSLQVGTIEGHVLDQSGAIVPGVTVTVTSPILLSARSTVTDAGGAYSFPSLPLGEYTVSFELSGFRKVARSGLTVTAARTLTVDVTLPTGEVSETLTVVGEAPTVDVTNTNIATSIDAKALPTIPTARDV